MSLVTLAFGDKSKARAGTTHAAVLTPADQVRQKIKAGSKASAVVRKACRFYGYEDVYVVAEVTDGYLSEDMTASFNGQDIELVSIESKYGTSAKKGMTVGLMVRGVDEEALPKDSVLSFEFR